MKGIALYGTKYGSSKIYAEELAKQMKFDLQSYDGVKSLNDYDIIVHFGGLYAGKVLGLKNIYNKKPPNATLILVTVGLSDTDSEKTHEEINKYIQNSVKTIDFDIFNLRGAIDFSKLNLLHKFMMKCMYTHLKSKEKTKDIESFLKTETTPVNFIDFETLKPIYDRIEFLLKKTPIN